MFSEAAWAICIGGQCDIHKLLEPTLAAIPVTIGIALMEAHKMNPCTRYKEAKHNSHIAMSSQHDFDQRQFVRDRVLTQQRERGEQNPKPSLSSIVTTEARARPPSSRDLKEILSALDRSYSSPWNI
jgi:hypothetical protein